MSVPDFPTSVDLRGSLPPIQLVAGDDRPDIFVKLFDANSVDPINLADPTISVFMKFREKGNDLTLQDIAGAKLDGGFKGEIKFEWPPLALDVTAGRYEGEVYVNFAGEIQTCPTLLKFKVREDFADVV